MIEWWSIKRRTGMVINFLAISGNSIHFARTNSNFLKYTYFPSVNVYVAFLNSLTPIDIYKNMLLDLRKAILRPQVSINSKGNMHYCSH